MNRLTHAAVTIAALATLIATACTPFQPAIQPAIQPATSAAPIAAPPAAAGSVAATPAASLATVSPGAVDAATADAVSIRLGETIAVDGAGATVNGSVVTITAGGAYRLTGALADGQVIVAARKDETVQLILDGAGVASSTSAPIFVQSGKTTIVLADGSQNYLADGVSRPATAAGSDEPNAALYSVVDLTITGPGALVVDGRYNDGIASKDDLIISGGAISVTSVADGVRGRDSLSIDGGTLTVNAGKDGLKASNDEDPEKGVVTIRGGVIQVNAREDGIQAETIVSISGGALAITSGGGSAGSVGADASAKGIKGTVALTIEGGTISVDAADDAVHSNGSLTIRGGTLLLASADDGLHADTALDIAGGDVTITNSNEGIESQSITIADGRIRIKSRDDGLNAAGGDGAAPGFGWPGQAAASASAATEYRITISGGYLVIDSDTDGIDANGSVEMSGGVAIVNGPTTSHDGALDYDRGFIITGGTLIAAGSAGMAQAPGATSTQPSVLVTFPASLAGGTLARIATASGEEIVTFAPSKAYQTLVVSWPKLTQGGAYVVQTGGASTGTATDGLYASGVYTDGAQAASFTVAGAVTTAGSAPANAGRGGGPRR